MKGFFKTLPELKTPRLVLRKLQLSDVNDLFDYCKEESVFQHTAYDSHKTPEESMRFIQSQLEAYERDEPATWGIELNEQKKLIGTLGFIAIDRDSRCGELGFALSHHYWKQGFMNEALQAVISYSFQSMRLNRLEAFCNPKNEAAMHTLQKVDFFKEGILRNKLLTKNGLIDICCWSIIPQDLGDKL